MTDFEKLGVFYLGKTFDLAAGKPREELLLYESKDLVTHAVCVGMTGSGKTGLCLTLLEEAAIDAIPAIVIDPKGDLANLLLTFPQLRGEEFLPWINESDAQRKGLRPEEFAQQQADLWKKGLGDWGQDGARIERLRQAADVAVYTPGSNAGLPVSIVQSFAAPPQAIRDDAEAFRDRVSATATSLLGLIGVEADPLRSREHILLSTVLGNLWSRGTDLDLAALIQQLQTPPVQRIGVMELETFFPAKDRFALAMQFNNLLATPGFAAWLEGAPLDIDTLLHTQAGKPRIAIFSIAHLNDTERMFFVSLLLQQVLGWVRQQPGTTSLRALVYMDEIYGYFPPVANPPSKTPLLTLLKQARAFGVGIVLATQNPVDLDYKGLANAGTWFIGRLQTERDKARVLEGLEGAAAGFGKSFDRPGMERILAGLGNRVFLMHNVHEDAPVVFQVRWTMSYLRGPLTRQQIKTLMADRRSSSATSPEPGKPAAAVVAGSDLSTARPVLPPEIVQRFLPVRSQGADGAQLVYQPAALGVAKVYFGDPKAGVDTTEDVALLAPIAADAIAWESATAFDGSQIEVEQEPAADARYGALPAGAARAKALDAWKKAFVETLFRTRKVTLYRSPALGVTSQAGETEAAFRVRLQQAGREERDRQVETLRKKYAPKIAALQDRIRRAQQATERESNQASQSKLNVLVSVGATLLGALCGRKTLSVTNITKATTAARNVGKSMKESSDVTRAEENVATLQSQLEALEAEFRTESDALAGRTDPTTETFEPVVVKPKKSNITNPQVSLAWAPHWQDSAGVLTPAWE